jgi:hypothetical protein
MLARMKQVMGEDTKVIATGGQAQLIARASKHIEHIDEFLTLEGLRIIWDRNRPEREAGTDAAVSSGTAGATAPKVRG